MREETLDHLPSVEQIEREQARNQHVEATMRNAILRGLAMLNAVQDVHQKALQADVVREMREALKS